MEVKLNIFRRSVDARPGRGLFSVREKKGVVAAKPPWPGRRVPHPENLSKFEDVYRKSAVVNAAINNLVDMIVGVGYYTEADDERAKNLVDDYAELVNLDGVLRVVCRNMLVFGFAPVERWWNETLQLKPLPPQTVYVVMDEKGNIEKYQQKTWSGRWINFDLDEIVWFAHNAYPGNPYGIGLIEPIHTLVNYKNRILEDICKIVHRYASPLNIWITRADVSNLKEAVENREPDEDIFIGHAGREDVEIKTLEMDPRGRYVDYLEVINQEIYECLQAPLLTYLKNATEASARVQLEVIDRHVNGVQRYIKRVVEKEVFRPIVERAGLSEVPRIRWGRPSTGIENLAVRDIAQLVQAYVLTADQAVDLLRKMGLPIEERRGEVK